MTLVRQGEALALQRRLASSPDRLALFAALTDNGRRSDTFLLERTAGPSMLMDQAAVRVECRGRQVVLFALSADGRNVLETVAESLAERVQANLPDRLTLTFPAPAGDDAETRLTAPSPFDVLRSIAALASVSGEESFTVACFGVVAYDHADLFEDLPASAEDLLNYPDFVFWLANL